jgi:DNA-binding NarL/FixJ family response regulator
MAVCLFILLQERIFADALAIRLEQEPDMEVAAALDTESLPPHLFVESSVNVVLLDADVAGNAAFRMCQELSGYSEAPHVIFISHSADPERIAGAIRAGADGWVREDESLDRLIYVIREVARGETCVPPDETAVLRRLRRQADRNRTRDGDEDGDGDRDGDGAGDGGAQLVAAPTGHGREVLVFLARGTWRQTAAAFVRTTLTLTKRATSGEGCQGRRPQGSVVAGPGTRWKAVMRLYIPHPGEK